MPEIRLTAAVDDRMGLSRDGRTPWDLPVDRRNYHRLVKSGPVAMGWNTFAANRYRPFGDGSNTVFTRRRTEAVPGVWIAHDAHEYFEKNKQDIWVAGGWQIYTEAMPYATHLYLTRVNGDFECDTYFPQFEHGFTLVESSPQHEENGIRFHYEIWHRIE